MNRKAISTIAVFAIISALAASGARGAGVSSAEFLLIGVGARAQGLGNAYTAVSSDINSIYWNQAGLGVMKRPEVSFMHNAWLDNMTYDYAAFGVPTKAGTFGFSVHYLNIGEITGRASQISEPYTFKAGDTMFTFGYGSKVIRNGYAGLNLKYIRENIDDVTATGFAADLGLLYKLPGHSLSFGLTARNIGGGMKYVNETENLPMNISLGAGYQIGGFGISMDLRHYAYDKTSEICVGTEFAPVSILSLRGGFLYNMLKNSAAPDVPSGGETFNPSGGMGFRFGGSQIDYSFTPFNQLGSTHKVSLTYGF
ncbi:MAG: PorV/PorQ family protein [Elusimicrobiota bacterium]